MTNRIGTDDWLSQSWPFWTGNQYRHEHGKTVCDVCHAPLTKKSGRWLVKPHCPWCATLPGRAKGCGLCYVGRTCPDCASVNRAFWKTGKVPSSIYDLLRVAYVNGGTTLDHEDDIRECLRKEAIKCRYGDALIVEQPSHSLKEAVAARVAYAEAIKSGTKIQ